MTSFPFPVLVSDIGGTNVRFALQQEPGAELGEVVHLKTHDYPGLAEAIEAAVPKLGAMPRAVIACGAGPVVERKLKLTNAPWHIDGQEVAKRIGLAAGLLLNDFEAQALSLPTIPAEWARRIGAIPFGAKGPQVILGPGTGLGIGALIEANGRHTPLASEACHIDFGPVTPEEWALWPHLERAHGRITTESVISGPGLPRVHRARMIARGAPAPDLDAPALVAAALADHSGEEAKSLKLYWRIVGRFAGDMAVAFVAFGGVTLSGVVVRVLIHRIAVMTLKAVVLPAPLGPIRLTTSPSLTTKFMSDIATRPPKWTVMCSIVSAGWIFVGRPSITAHPAA